MLGHVRRRRWALGYHPAMTEQPQEEARPSARLVLASQSPRRRRLLAWLGLPFEVAAVDTPEELDSPLAERPARLAAHLAAEKAVAAHAEGFGEDALVLTFDTIVVHEGALLGKPRDVPDAWRMLRSLAGQTHQVVTGVALMCATDEAPRTFSVTTSVAMKPLTDCQIEAWMAFGEFMGCAGAYNIEGQVAEVSDDECYQNVAGLPLCHLCAALAAAEAPACLEARPHSPIGACDAALGRSCRLGPRIVGASG
jgi:septum formation protein